MTTKIENIINLFFASELIKRMKKSEIFLSYNYFRDNIDSTLAIEEYPKILRAIFRIIFTQFYNKLFPGFFYDHYVTIPHKFKKDRDFGNLVYKGPQLIESPTTIEELQTFIKQANQNKTPVHFCGSSHSSNGLTLSQKGGVRLYLKKIKPTFCMINDDVVEFRGMTTIRQLAKFLAQHERCLPVVGDQLDLTLGGYLSAGGVGYNSIEYGFLSDHVTKIELLVASGDILHCSEINHQDIFHAVLGGQGQLGIIIAAQIRVIKRMPLYLRMDVCPLKKSGDVIDILEKTASQDFNHLFIIIHYCDNMLELFYLTGKTFHGGETKKSLSQSVEAVLGKDFIPIRKTHFSRPKYNRIAPPTGYPLFELLTNKWLWSEYIIPLSKLKEIWQDLEPFLLLKQSSIYFYLSKKIKSSQGQHSFLGHPSQGETEVLLFFGLFFTFYTLSSQDLEDVKSKLDSLFLIIIQKGAKPYYHGYHPNLKEKYMRSMYPKFDQYLAIKSLLDPNQLFNSDWFAADEPKY